MFDKLSKDLQDLLRAETIQHMKKLTEASRKENVEAVEEMKSSGVKVVPFASREGFEAGTEKTQSQLTGNVFSAELLGRVTEILEKHRGAGQ